MYLELLRIVLFFALVIQCLRWIWKSDRFSRLLKGVIVLVCLLPAFVLTFYIDAVSCEVITTVLAFLFLGLLVIIVMNGFPK